VCDEVRSERLSLSRAQHVVCADCSHARRQDYCVCEVAAMPDIQMETFISQLKKTAVKTVPLHHSSRHPLCGHNNNRQFETSSWRFCHMHLAVRTSHHATFIFFFPLPRIGHYVGGFGSVKK